MPHNNPGGRKARYYYPSLKKGNPPRIAQETGSGRRKERVQGEGDGGDVGPTG